MKVYDKEIYQKQEIVIFSDNFMAISVYNLALPFILFTFAW